jgi:hypothetical protein
VESGVARSQPEEPRCAGGTRLLAGISERVAAGSPCDLTRVLSSPFLRFYYPAAGQKGNAMWTTTADGSVVDSHGKIILFSTERFVRDICLGDCCFICGASPNDKTFNNEHILPEWLLRRFDLFSRQITLPNGRAVRYGSYTVPCCAECNSLMGKEIEEPISQVVAGGAHAISEYVLDGHLLNMFVWLGLIFLKTHLKDRLHNIHLDQRRGTEKIADDYEWERLHHLHCLVRCFYTDCRVRPEALGSFLTLPVKRTTTGDPFDFADLYLAQTMLLCLDDIGIVTVFDDSSARRMG